MSILYFRNSDGKFVPLPTIPGKSAYEIAVERGVFSGTEQEFAEMQVINNKDIIDQITQENIDNWNNTIDRIELTDREQLVFYSGDTIISRIQLQKGMTDEEKKKLDTKLSMKFDDVQLNEAETTDMQTAIDFFSNGKLMKTVYFENNLGAAVTSAYISTTLEENVMINTNENFELSLDFASPNLGKGTLKVFINDIESISKSIGQGESTTVIEGSLFSKGNNRVVVYVLDRVGVMSNSLTFYVRYGGTEITSDFDQYSAYDYGATIRYYFTPTAVDTSLTLTFYMSIDGTVQQGVSCTSDTRGYYTFPTNLSADSHYCEAYIIDSNGTKSNVLKFNLIILNTNTLVVASDTKSATVEEGEQLSLDYKVYMKNNTSFITKAYVDNNLVNTGTCNADFNYYKTSSLTEGMHTVKLEVWDVTETYHDYVTWTITVTPSTYEMKQPINAGAMFIGTAVNKTNTDERKQYFIGHDQEGNEVLGTLSNFAYNSESGWVNDELIISGNSHVEIPIQPLANNAKYGFTLDIEFTSKQIGVTDAEVLTLWNNETNCGIKITTEKLILQSSNGNKCDLYFTDNERTHVMFIIDRQELKAKIYLNGVMCEAFHLNDYTVDGVAYLDDFTVNSNIVLGGLNKNGYCKIRNLRVYQVALTTDEIINNFISCEIDKGRQRELVEFQKGNDLPTLYVYCDFSGLGKDDKKPCKIVYQSTNEELYGKSFNLDHYKSQLQYQGTSSMAYPIKNYRLNLRDEFGDKWYYDFPGGQGECRFTLKADFMSSGHWTNTGMAKFINDNLYNYKSDDEKSMNPFRWYRLQNGDDVSKYRETINGFPCRLILINDGSTPLNEGQNEPTPGNTKDMGIFNFNNDKDNVTTLGFDSDIFPNCASYEVTANSDTSAGAFISYMKSKNIFKHENAFNGYIIDGENHPCEIKTYNGAKVYLAAGSTPVNSTFKIRNCFKENTVYTLQFNYTVPDSVGWAMVYIRYTDGTAQALGYKDVVNPTLTSNTDKTIEQIDFINPGTCYIYSDSILLVEGGIPEEGGADELAYLKESFELRHPDKDDVAEDWGFMGVENNVYLLDYFDNSNDGTRRTEGVPWDGESAISATKATRIGCYGSSGFLGSVDFTNGTAMPLAETTHTVIIFPNQNVEDFILNGRLCLMRNKVPSIIPGGTLKEEAAIDPTLGLKALIDWVDNCTDEEFVADFEEHFHKDYTLRYFCLVTLIGAVDNLGKNMMLDTADNKIFFPRFYDIDTICSYDNSGQLKFDVDIEMEQGYWNTSSSRLWTRIRDLMHDDIVTTYNDMRQNGVSYENMMHYIYDEQIAKIPQAYYNKDYDIKYAPFADSYIGMAHGDTYEHVKRWLKQRFTFVDTLFDYAPSYNNDVLTIRANTTELMTLEIETYTPVYQHVSWYNGQMDKKKIDGKVSVEFSGTAQAATDQEVLIYGGSNVKSIKGITSMNPNRMLIGSATKLIEIDAHDCPLLADINANKANLSPHEYLNKVDLSNCPLLEGNLKLNNSPLVQELDIRGTNITGMNLPGSIRNLQVLRLPNTMTELTLNDANMLHTLEFDEGVNLQSISMTNCNALENVTGFDLLQTPSITLNNSYNTVAELYFRDTTNLSLSNMSNLERVIFTPNNEYETFELINVANAPDYKITTFNCPKLSTFMTTAPYRESFNNCGMKDGEEFETVTETIDLVLSRGTGFNSDGSLKTGQKDTCYADVNFYEVKVGTTCTIEKDGNWSYIVEYNENKEFVRLVYSGENTEQPTYSWIAQNPYVRIGANNGTFIKLTRNYDKVITIQVKDYGDIQPNTTFTANSIDISSTQFTDVKLLCTTDTNTLKLPTTVKNFYCDSSFDLDTDYLEDGEYDVVHGELVEPYTTDYDGEVVKVVEEQVTMAIKDIDTTWKDGYRLSADGNEFSESNRCITDFIRVSPNSLMSVPSGNFAGLIQYDINKNYITGGNWVNNVTLDANCAYVRLDFVISAPPFGRDDGQTLTFTPYVECAPNLIPSSADGSLIFSMYAPNNTVAPSSGTWDLKGLEFDNFHTYGMNNDVKIIAEKTQNINFAEAIELDSLEFDLNIELIASANNNRGYIQFSDGFKMRVIYFNRKSIAYATNIGSWVLTNLKVNDSSSATKLKLSVSEGILTYYLDGVSFYSTNLNNIPYYNDTIYNKISIELVNDGGFDSIISSKTLTSPSNDINDIKSITMPSRYDDYNITIKNANISPKEHNTMLYPLLVNEDNPIEGKLDYTNYEGNNLSWSFAYVNMNKVNIVQPKDELLNTYEYRYNAFYETEYEFDDPNEVLRYITSSSNLLPTFNEGFTYTYDKLDNNDGTYIYRIYANDPTLLTSFELEKVPYLRITNAENLLSPIDLTKYETVSISESYYDITELYFSEATNLTLTNMPYLERVIYLPNDEYEVFEIINVVNSKDYIITTSECPRLTTFMTTASHRESYNNEDVIAEVITEFTNTDNELFTNEYVFSKTYWEEDGTEVQGSVNLLHYEIPSIEDNVKAIHMVQGLDSTNRVTFFNDDKFISCEVITTACGLDFKLHRDCNRIVFICEREGIVSSVVESILTTTLVKEYGSVEPNIIFNANTLDISNTQFTDVKLLCTTDLNVLKLPTTVKNFYCDSSFDLDTDYLTDGEYNAVHGELVELYTTDYEDEVVYIKENEVEVLLRDIDTVWKDGYFLNTNGNENSNADRCVSDYIRVVPNTRFILSKDGITQYVNIGALVQYDINKQYITGSNWTNNVTLDTNCAYIRLDHTIVGRDEELLVITFTPYIEYHPNIIPSSSDGSLIFSMYAPSKAPAPASNTWDLYGLEFDNFHTYGMNNDVKGELEVKELRNNTTIYRILDERYNSNTLYGLSYGTASGTPGSYSAGCSISPILLDEDITSITITTSNGCSMLHYNSTDYDGVTATAQGFSGGGTLSGATLGVVSERRLRLITFQNDTNLEWFDMTLVGNETKTIRYYMEDMIIVDVNDERRKTWNTVSYDTIYETTSLSMPSRYNNYNVTIKNANIKPTTHNTMLYPLLVNEDNPIEGKLDYTDYNGEYLSWSFAYTNTNKVNIIQPKDELLNTYGYRYNAFYRTEYEFNNPNEVMEYTTTSSNLLPIFNEGFTYAYDKIDNDNGTYTYKIYANDISSLTSFELEKVPYLRIVNAENLISPIDLTKYEVVEIDNSYNSVSELYFKDATDLTLNNILNLERVIYVPNSEYDTFELINITNASNYNIVTFNCPKLSTFMTTAPYRESYNNCESHVEEKEVTSTVELLDGTYVIGGHWDNNGQYTASKARNETALIEDNTVNHHLEVTENNTVNYIVRVNYLNNDTFISRIVGTIPKVNGNWTTDLDIPDNCNKVIIAHGNNSNSAKISLTFSKTETVQYEVKDYGDIQPNTTFTANSIDISNTQFTDVKLLCTTDTNTLKLPTTVKNFYCDSSFDLDTNFLEDGEYDVVHGELVEPYTTDYEGEVIKYDEIHYDMVSDWENLQQGQPSTTDNSLTDADNSRRTTDYLRVSPGTTLTIEVPLGLWDYRYVEYDENKNILQYSGNAASNITGGSTQTLTLSDSTHYVRVGIWRYENNKTVNIIYNQMKTQSLIPSSADGSLIFSMYAPNNTVAPVSGVWDLKGLEFDNFHTFGMNNDVKVGEDSYVKVVNPSDIIAYTGKATNVDYPLGQIYWDTGQAKNIAFTCIRLSAGGHTITTNDEKNVLIFAYSNIGDTTKTNHYGAAGFTFDSPKYISFQVPNTTEYIEIDGCRIYFDEITIIDGQLAKDSSGWYNYLECGGKEIIFDEVRVDEILIPTSISMPSRYDDYNITIKNANISPKTHNTMLYPLLVNEDNPITGTLDYTNYAGKHLSWSFAYTDEEYVDIIQPKDELINSYKYKYNTYYDTEYEFDNPYEIAKYTSSASGVLPTFNTEFTYTYDEKDNRDGTYTTKVYADSLDNLPTRMKFNYSDVIEILKWNTSNVTDMSGMFYGCNQLKKINNIESLVTSNVTNISKMFYNCKVSSLDLSKWDTSNVTNMEWLFRTCTNLTDLDVSGFNTSNVTNMSSMFDGCNNLTSLNLSGFNTSKVTSMDNMFANCNALTSLDVSGLDTKNVTEMTSMFSNCSKLTSLDVSNFDTSNVTNMRNMFTNCFELMNLQLGNWNTKKVTTTYGMFSVCKKIASLNISNWDTSSLTDTRSMFNECMQLTELDLSNWTVSNVTNMNDMFKGCNKLTSLDVREFDTSNVTSMESMFFNCSSLKEVKGIENWDCSKVSKFGSMFQGATAFGGDLDLRNWKVGQNTTVTTIYSFMNGCANLKSVDMSGWVLPDGINFANFMSNQGSLHTVRVIGWSARNIQNLCGAIGTYVGGTIYGDVIIDETYLQNGWVYNNVLEVAIYTCSASGVLPTFNAEFTYTHAEVDNGDGTYTTKISADSSDNLPTQISFYNIKELIEVHKLNTSEVTTMQAMFQHCKTLTTINSSSWDTSKVTNMKYMFNNCSALTTLDVSNWNTKNVVSMYGTFSGCTQLTTLDVGKWNTKNVDTMQLLFSDCPNITTLDVSNFDTSNVINMSSMFNGCQNLTSLDVSNFDTSNVTNMSMMFKNCNKLIALNVSNFDTSKVTNMGEMFSGCNVLSIEGLGNWDVKNVTDMGSMFLHCRGITSLLEISDWDTSSSKGLSRTFMGCTELIELDVSNWNASKFETLNETFYDCKKIISFNLGNWDCRRVISISGAFHGCTSLSSITLPKEVSKGCNSVSAFRNCTNLKEVTLPKGVGDIAHIFNNCNNLEKAVIPLDNINNAQDSTFNNCRALIDVDWVGDLSNNFNIIANTGEHITTESDVHELMTNLGDLKKDKIKISLSKGTIKVNDTEKTIE